MLPFRGTVVIVSGAIALSGYGIYLVDTEGAAATDDLDTINGTSQGNIVILFPVSDARTVVVRHNIGNIHLMGALNFSLNELRDFVELFNRDGSELDGFGVNIPS